jgi:hypothetical protein
MIFLFPLVLIAVIALPLIFAYHQKVNGRAASSIKKTLITNISVFALVVLAAVILPIGGFVSAASVSAVNATNISVGAGLGYLAAALATGISGIGAGIAVAPPLLAQSPRTRRYSAAPFFSSVLAKALLYTASLSPFLFGSKYNLKKSGEAKCAFTSSAIILTPIWACGSPVSKA